MQKQVQLKEDNVIILSCLFSFVQFVCGVQQL